MADVATRPAKREQVFLISQIGREGSDIRKRANVIHDHIVTPITAEFELRVLRSDRDPTPGPVTSQILRSILDSRVVIADLSGKNENVYYELAFSHSFGKPVVILVDDPENLSFDVKNERVIAIHDEGSIDMDQGEVTKAELRKALEVTLAGGYTPRSLVTEVAERQELQRLSPENPIATELNNIRQRVDQIYRELPAREKRTDTVHDVRQLSTFVRALAQSGRLHNGELADLIDASTSNDFDDYVRKLIESVPKAEESAEDWDDIPF